MEVFGLCVLISTVLVLVDRNQAWPKFWRFARWAAIILIAGCAGLYVYDRYEARKAQAATPWVDYQPPDKQ